MRIGILLTLLCVICVGMAAGAPRVLLEDDFSSDSLAGYTHPPVYDIFERVPEPATWQVRDGKLVAEGTFAPWSYQLAGDESWMDYAVSVTMTIERAQEPGRNYKPEVYDFYQTQARDYFDELAPGYEAALVARYRGEKSFYRLQFSTRWQEVALWEPSAGYLYVAPCPLQVGKPYKVMWRLQGNHIEASVNGKKLINAWDRLKPFRSGKVGVGVYDAGVSFDDLRVEALPAESQRDPGYKPFFTMKSWHGGQWIFDGAEPVAAISGTRLISLDRVKLRPGCWPFMWTWLYWDVYFKHADELVAFKVTEQDGPRLGMYIEARHSQFDVTSKRQITLSYEEGSDSYVWHCDCEVEFGPQFKETRPPNELQVTDPFVANCCAPPQGVKRPWETAWGWVLIQGPEGKLYKNPLHHDKDYFEADRKEIPEGGFSALVLNEMLNPAWEMLDNPEGLKLEQASCNWAYDHHLYYRFPPGYKLRPGTKLRAVFRVVNYPFSKAKALLERAALHPQYDLSKPDTKERVLKAAKLEAGPPRWEFLVSTIDCNRFDKSFTLQDVHAEYMIKGNYVIDRTVGHTDSCSLRLEGPAYALLDPWGGPSYYGDAFKADRYVLSVWVKTEGVRGTGPIVRLANRHKGAQNRSVELVPGISGTADWQKLVMVTDIPKGDAGLMGRLELKGTGKAWFDDLELRPLAPGEKPPKPTPSISRRGPAGDIVCNLAFAEGEGIGVFDGSGHDNHARIASGKWVETDGRRAVELDGDGDYLMIPSDPTMFHPEAMSLAMWIRPAQEETVGSAWLFDQYNDLWFRLTGNRPPYRLRANLNTQGGPVAVETSALIPADRWTHVALTFNSEELVLYVNGKESVRADAKGPATFARRANFYLGCHWASTGWYSGALGSLTMWRTALAAKQVAEHASRSLAGSRPTPRVAR